MMESIAGILVMANPATEDVYEDASTKPEKIAPKIKDSIVETETFNHTKRNGYFVDRPIL